jgi:hypothetical protein
MLFEIIFKLGAVALLSGLLLAVFFYVRYRNASSAEPKPVFIRYFGFAALLGFAAYLAGTAIGIAFACASPAAGNLCGIYGALGSGPLLAGITFGLYGPCWRMRTSR